MKEENLVIYEEIVEAIKMIYQDLLDLRIYLLERCIEEGTSKEIRAIDESVSQVCGVSGKGAGMDER